MPDITSRVPVAPQPQPQPQPHWDYPQYPPPPGVRPDLAFVPVQRTPRDTKRRWPALAVAAAASAAIAATVTALITSQVVRTDAGAGHTTAPAAVTVTETPAPPAPPAPLPTAQADHATCDAWRAAGDKIHAASDALAAIPKGSTILDPQVRDNPELSGAARKAADFYGQAGDTLAAGIAPGTTTILERSATAAAAALRALSTGDATLDAASGNTYHVVRESADTMDVLCNRLAP